MALGCSNIVLLDTVLKFPLMRLVRHAWLFLRRQSLVKFSNHIRYLELLSMWDDIHLNACAPLTIAA